MALGLRRSGRVWLPSRRHALGAVVALVLLVGGGLRLFRSPAADRLYVRSPSPFAFMHLNQARLVSQNICLHAPFLHVGAWREMGHVCRKHILLVLHAFRQFVWRVHLSGMAHGLSPLIKARFCCSHRWKCRAGCSPGLRPPRTCSLFRAMALPLGWLSIALRTTGPPASSTCGRPSWPRGRQACRRAWSFMSTTTPPVAPSGSSRHESHPVIRVHF